MSLANPSRRGSLRAGGLLLATVNLPAPLFAPAEQGATDLLLDQVDSFIAIAANDKVTAFCGHVDPGTDIRMALAQIVAEELDIAFEQVEMILGDTHRTSDQGPTIASASTQVSAVSLRQAAAEARHFLLRQAGSHFPVHLDSLRNENGQVFAAVNPQRRIGYGELLRGQRFNLNIDGRASFKPRNEYRLVDKLVRRVDIPVRLTGQLTYVHGIRLPGMLHGRVVCPPYTGTDVSVPLGSGLLAVDESSVAGLPGLVKTVVVGDFVGVVCEREEQAIRVARQLRVRWRDWQGLPPLELDRLEDTPCRHPRKPHTLHDSPGLEQYLAGIARPLSATYVWPYQLHASTGPSCALAEIDAQHARVRSGTQSPHDLRNDLVRLLQRETGDIEVIRTETAGCYGRNGADDANADAVLLAQAVDRPVRIQLMREQEHGWEPEGTAQLIEVRGGLDEQSRVVAYDFATCYPSNGTPTLALLSAGRIPTTPQVVDMGDRTAIPQYRYPRMRVVANNAALIVCASWIRGVSALPNVFAHESHVDELAHSAGIDPIAFCRRYLDDQRALALIDAPVARAGWQPRTSPNPEVCRDGVLKGRGFAYVRYFHSKFPGFGAVWVAWIVDVEVNPENDAVRVAKVWVARDCGQMVSPGGVRHQVHGNVIQSTSRVLKEFATFDRHGVTSLGWGGYPILGFPELPEIDVLLLDHPEQPPTGAGESASVPSAVAIANAIFNATGACLRQVPFTPERVLTALRSAQA